MDCFMLAVSVVLPLFLYMLVGVLIRHFKIFTEENFKAVNRMIFHVLIPLTLFFSVYKVDLKSAVEPKLYVYVWLSVIAVFCILYMVFRKVLHNTLPECPAEDSLIKLNRLDAATMLQGMFRSNFVLFGVSIASSLCDEEGVAAISALAAIVVPTFNILAVILFESVRGEKVSVKKMLAGILKNPLVDAGILGIAASVLKLRLPELITGPFEKLGDAATPLALVVLGGMLSIKSISAHRYYLVFSAFIKLVFIPLVTVGLGIIAGFRGNNLVAVLAVFAAPTAVASTPMAQAMGGNGKLAGEIVAVTSAGCIVTIFLWVFVLSGMGFI